MPMSADEPKTSRISGETIALGTLFVVIVGLLCKSNYIKMENGTEAGGKLLDKLWDSSVWAVPISTLSVGCLGLFFSRRREERDLARNRFQARLQQYVAQISSSLNQGDAK